ncbi:MAG TPA: ATP synthase F1 subunit epsilon [Actinomycetota bacterium]|nr:ATP synthase F1 subunit epsilon [Actinomycetota bacterium]
MLDVHLVTPEREVWAGAARMVVARGVAGEVGILPGHVPLLIRLAIARLRIEVDEGRWENAVVDGGFLHVTSEGGTTRVDVLAAHAQMATEIDAVAARARAEELQRQLGDRKDARAQAELRKALARANVTG